ncbi:MAG: regulatory protein RecX, partial [Chitinophagaceae bacterium]
QEVRNKLYELGLYTADVEQQIALLIERDLLNEERFARAYARGKFRLKKWGRVKITQGLKQRRISPYLIKLALTEIDVNEYFRTLEELAGKKLECLSKERNSFKKNQRVYAFLAQRGFESQMIREVLNSFKE